MTSLLSDVVRCVLAQWWIPIIVTVWICTWRHGHGAVPEAARFMSKVIYTYLYCTHFLDLHMTSMVGSTDGRLGSNTAVRGHFSLNFPPETDLFSWYRFQLRTYVIINIWYYHIDEIVEHDIRSNTVIEPPIFSSNFGRREVQSNAIGMRTV